MTAENTMRVGIITLGGVLGTVVLFGGGMTARATDVGSDTLNVASLEQLPEGSLNDERGGAFTSKFNLNFSLHAIVTAAGETKFQKDIAPSGSQSQTTSQVSNTTVTQTSSANLSTGPSVSFNVVVGP
jgi:hypothetical protein